MPDAEGRVQPPHFKGYLGRRWPLPIGLHLLLLIRHVLLLGVTGLLLICCACTCRSCALLQLLQLLVLFLLLCCSAAGTTAPCSGGTAQVCQVRQSQALQLQWHLAGLDWACLLLLAF
jgi:hypothetical protein